MIRENLVVRSSIQMSCILYVCVKMRGGVRRSYFVIQKSRNVLVFRKEKQACKFC